MTDHTLRGIRRSIGYDIQGALSGGMRVQIASHIETDADGQGILRDPTNQLSVGQWIVVDGTVAAVRDILSNGDYLLSKPLNPSANSDFEYEVWDQKYYPPMVNSLINQAIQDAETNGVYVPVTEDLAYLPPSTRRIASPSGWLVLREVAISGESMGYGYGSYIDLLPSIQQDDDSEDNDSFFPFHTVHVVGQHSFTLDQKVPLGLYDSIGWEVAGDFDGKVGAMRDWEFVRQSFDPFSATFDTDGYLTLDYNAGVGAYILSAYLYRESYVRWRPVEYTVWQNSGEIELTGAVDEVVVGSEGGRVRFQGGRALTRLRTDDPLEAESLTTELSPSYIRAQALVSLLRAIPDIIVGEETTPIRREWELRALTERGQLHRMQNTRRLS